MKTRKNKKGISLIVLVITIIVMIILAAAIIISISNSGIVNRANEAVDETNKSQAIELANMIWANEYLAGKRGNELVQAVETELEKQGVSASDYGIEIGENGISFGKTDTNDPEPDFDENAWEFAYTYTSSNQEWSSKILATDTTTLTGDIIVKFYNNGVRLTPPSFSMDEITLDFYEGETYTMLIQGQGNMSTLMVMGDDGMPANGYAWQLDSLMYMQKPSLKCAVIPFVTEVIIEEGIKNIGIGAFLGATSLTKINVVSKEEWDNTIIGQYNYELIDIPATYEYRTKVERLANEGLEKAKSDGVAENVLQTAVTNYITARGVSNETLALYNINATATGVKITGKETTLGATILSGADYGKTVNYTANGISDWKVLYKQTVDGEEYVYLIASENIEASSIPAKFLDTEADGGSEAATKR